MWIKGRFEEEKNVRNNILNGSWNRKVKKNCNLSYNLNILSVILCTQEIPR